MGAAAMTEGCGDRGRFNGLSPDTWTRRTDRSLDELGKSERALAPELAVSAVRGHRPSPAAVLNGYSKRAPRRDDGPCQRHSALTGRVSAGRCLVGGAPAAAAGVDLIFPSPGVVISPQASDDATAHEGDLVEAAV
jgi:hypothetical protein